MYNVFPLYTWPTPIFVELFQTNCEYSGADFSFLLSYCWCLSNQYLTMISAKKNSNTVRINQRRRQSYEWSSMDRGCRGCTRFHCIHQRAPLFCCWLCHERCDGRSRGVVHPHEDHRRNSVADIDCSSSGLFVENLPLVYRAFHSFPQPCLYRMHSWVAIWPRARTYLGSELHTIRDHCPWTGQYQCLHLPCLDLYLNTSTISRGKAQCILIVPLWSPALAASTVPGAFLAAALERGESRTKGKDIDGSMKTKKKRIPLLGASVLLGMTREPMMTANRKQLDTFESMLEFDKCSSSVVIRNGNRANQSLSRSSSRAIEWKTFAVCVCVSLRAICFYLSW